MLKQSLFFFGLAAIIILPFIFFRALFRRKSSFLAQHPGVIVLAITWCFYVCIYHSLANLPINHPLFYGVNTRFWLQPNSVAFILSAVACVEARDAISRLISTRISSIAPVSRDDDVLLWCLQQPRLRSALANVVIAAAAAYTVAVQLRINWNSQNYSQIHMIDVLARTALESAPPNALLLASGDIQFGPTM